MSRVLDRLKRVFSPSPWQEVDRYNVGYLAADEGAAFKIQWKSRRVERNIRSGEERERDMRLSYSQWYFKDDLGADFDSLDFPISDTDFRDARIQK